MINIAALKEGNIVKILVDNKNRGLKKGDLLRVVETGYSSWDQMHYAELTNDKGSKFEIMKDFRDYELIC